MHTRALSPRLRRLLLGGAFCGLLVWLVYPPATAEPLFDETALHEIWLHIDERDWTDLRATYLKNTFYRCDVEWRGLRVRNAGCRSRGGGSRSPAKPGLLVQFDRYVNGQTWLGLESLVLDNLTQDPSMMKERLSMRLLDRMGLPAPRVAHTRLYVGSRRDYAGLYTVVENVDEPFLARRFGTDAGYLYEYRWQDEYRFGDLGADLETYATRFEARTHRRQSDARLYAPIRDLMRAVAEATPDNIEAAVAPHLDLRGFVQLAAVENFLSEWDGLLGYAGLNNFYLYRAAADQPARVIPWDKDLAFEWLEMPPSHNVDSNVLMSKAWQVPELRRLYLDTLLATTEAAADLTADLEATWGLIAAAAGEDRLKPYSDADVEAEVQDLRRFARERGAIVRRLAQDAAKAGPDAASR